MYLQGQNGLMTTFREHWRTRGVAAYLTSFSLMFFYVILYFRDDLGLRGTALDLEWYANFLPLIRNRWFIYGLLYCVFMVAGGIYYLRRHGNSEYNRRRIFTNIFFQIAIAFTLPLVMPMFFTDDTGEMWKYEIDNYLWPLAWYDLHPGTLQSVPIYIAVFSIVGALLFAPLMAYFYGKRWYCSWVCGCGGLANTFGDPWRHLTATSTKSWRFEKAAVHTVMFLAVASTFLLILDGFIGSRSPTFHHWVAGEHFWSMKKLYGFVVGSVLAGVVGTGLYPLFGPRVWCRNFCPMAAMLGLSQKLGRFRIAVKPDMCISCGNCTTYCEMGIDVRSYAQSNESFTRAACVGCGMCAHVCPRGVLKLENAPKQHKEKKRQRLPVVDL